MNELSIIVFTTNERGKHIEILPLCLSSTDFSRRINSLMVSSPHPQENDLNGDEEEEDVQSKNRIYHFAYIKNLSELLHRQLGDISH